MTNTATRHRVLVADDYRDSADGLAMLLRLFGHEVRVAYDGEEATRVAATFAPDLAILDLTMPGMDGCAAARCIRSTSVGNRVVLVALTGRAGASVLQASRDAGFDAHVVKPFDAQQIERLVGSLTHGQSGPLPSC